MNQIIHTSYISREKRTQNKNDKTEVRIVLETGTAHWTGQIIVSLR